MKKTIALVFAALSVATFGCNKSKTDTANPEDAAAETPAETPADAPADAADAEETPAESAPAEGGDAAAPE